MWVALLGAILAGLLVRALRRVQPHHALRLWALLLLVAAAIYVGFALVGNAPAHWFLVEAGGLMLFAILAMLGLRWSPWVLGLAWFAHIAWDALLHSHDAAFVPQWYPPVCIGFDLVVGAYIVLACSRARDKAAGVNGIR